MSVVFLRDDRLCFLFSSSFFFFFRFFRSYLLLYDVMPLERFLIQFRLASIFMNTIDDDTNLPFPSFSAGPLT